MALIQPEKTIALPTRNYQSGTRQINSLPVAVEVEGVTIAVDRSQLTDPKTNDNAIRLQVELSLDGGQTYPMIFGFTTPDGVYRLRDGTIVTESLQTFDFPEPQNPNRRIRGAMTLTTDMRIGANITVF